MNSRQGEKIMLENVDLHLSSIMMLLSALLPKPCAAHSSFQVHSSHSGCQWAPGLSLFRLRQCSALAFCFVCKAANRRCAESRPARRAPLGPPSQRPGPDGPGPCRVTVMDTIMMISLRNPKIRGGAECKIELQVRVSILSGKI